METQKLKNYIILLLSKKMYTEYEIRTKIQKKFPEVKEVDVVVEEFIKQKLIDDNEFVRVYLEYYLENFPKGKMGNFMKLKLKGINYDLFNTVWEELDVNEYEIAKKLLEKNDVKFSKLEKLKKIQRKMSFLQRRGFDSQVINNLVYE